MKIGFIFPGQGSQHPGMGKDIFQQFSCVKALYDQAADICNLDIAKACFERSSKKLALSSYSQLGILTMSLAVSRILAEHGIRPDIVAGHSLGEYSALVDTGAVSFKDGFNLVKKRGELMDRSCRENPGTMAAVTGLSFAAVEALCRDSASPVWPANENTHEQIVISGTQKGVKHVMKTACMNQGKAVALPVAGAFHSPLMTDAAKAFASVIQQVSVNPPSCPIIGNTDARVKTSPDQLSVEMKAQMTSPVLWFRSMKQMKDMGVSTFIEVGPKKVLKGLLMRIDRKIKIFSTGTLRELDQLIQAVT
nr:ACP S-malonyltransferase [uncultured Desulfobacter sp.]